MLQSVTECYKVLQSVTECCRVSQCVAEFYRVLESFTEYYRILQSNTEYYRVLRSVSSASTWTNFWACFVTPGRLVDYLCWWPRVYDFNDQYFSKVLPWGRWPCTRTTTASTSTMTSACSNWMEPSRKGFYHMWTFTVTSSAVIQMNWLWMYDHWHALSLTLT